LEYRCTSFPYKGTVEVYSKDVECLNAEEFLNDTIIDFWMSYHCDNRVESTDFRRIVVFSSLFYRSLVRHKQAELANGCSSFPRSNWTKGINNIFRKDFIFVPIPEE
jgi:Ulp1 family protease